MDDVLNKFYKLFLPAGWGGREDWSNLLQSIYKMQENPNPATRSEVHRSLHRLWGMATQHNPYNKQAWMDLQTSLAELERGLGF